MEFPSPGPTRGAFLNPELEVMRDKVLRESADRSDDWIKDLIAKTSRIHAGFLFADAKTLQDLCLFIGETRNKITDPGWISFGYHLGLNPCVLKVIDHNNFNKEDPTYNTLLAYVQHEDATVGKIIGSLRSIGRLDVISRVGKSVSELADKVLKHADQTTFISGTRNNSDHERLFSEGVNNNTLSRLESEFAFFNDFASSNLNKDDGIIRPKVIPPAPFIYRNLKVDPEVTSKKIREVLDAKDSSLNVLNNNYDKPISIGEDLIRSIATKSIIDVKRRFECIQTSAVPNLTKGTSRKKRHYGKIVMLTYAADGERYVGEICKILRRERDGLPKMGVLVLAEHEKEVAKDPHNFIVGSFHQVDYVCPILTESYLSLIRRQDNSPNPPPHSNLDVRYAQFVYALATNHYISNGCLNDKVRCIVPDELLHSVHANPLMSVPIFGAWVKASQAEELAVRLLKSKS